MIVPVPTTECLAPSDSQKSAFLKLLTDEDPLVYQTVRAKILSYGDAVGPWLRGVLLSNDPLLRRRVKDIVDLQGRAALDNEFLGFCLRQGEEFHLEDGVWLLARTQYPDINVEGYMAVLDEFVHRIRERMEPRSRPETTLQVINTFFFNELRFLGNEQNYYDPDNTFLNRVIDRRTGNPISLCLVYLFLCRRMKLPVTGIGMPGHFVCRLQTSSAEIYIDVFNQGRFLSKADCIKYLIQSSHGFQENYLAPVSSRRVLMRMCSNLHQIYSHLNLAEDTSRLQRYIVALAK